MTGIGRDVAAALISAAMFSKGLIASPTSRPAMDLIPPPPTEDQPVEKLLDHRLPTVRLPGITLSDSIDFIRDITGMDIYVDWKAVDLAGVGKDARVTVDAKDIPIREVFKQILGSTGSTALEIQVMEGTVVVSTKLNFKDRKAQVGPYLAELSDPAQAAADLDKPMARVSLVQTRFADAIDFIRDITGDSIQVNWQVLTRAGIDRNTPVTLNLRQARLSSVLYFLLSQAGDGKLGYITEPSQKMVFDKTLNQRVPKPATVITISTIDDLIAGKSNPTTQPN